jgi:acyl carrier protein
MLDESKIKTLIGSILGLDPSAIEMDTSSDNVEAWDSLRHMNLVLAIEEEFNVSIPDEDAANITSYALILLVLAELLGE